MSKVEYICCDAEIRKVYLHNCTYKFCLVKKDFEKLPGNIICSDNYFVKLACKFHLTQGNDNVSAYLIDDVFR